jgi:hypothetical protein
MPRMKPARRGTPVGPELLARDPATETEEDAEWEDILHHVAYSPARAEILLYRAYAHELGMPNDIDTLRRAVIAGEREHEKSRRHDEKVVTFRALIKAAAPSHHHPAVVYYMRMGDLVKIGTSTNIRSRIATLNTQGVMAVEPGSYAVERERHAQFAHLRGHGEWFILGEDLAAHIADVREQFAAETGSTVEQWVAERTPPRRRKQEKTRRLAGCAIFSLTNFVLPSRASQRCPETPETPTCWGSRRMLGEVPLLPTADLDAGLPRSLAAAAVRVSPHVVSMWALRGWIDLDGTHRKLTVVGHDFKGQRLYRFGDVLEAERATRRNRRSSRHPDRAERQAA